MAGRAELEKGRGLRAKCKSLIKTTWKHHERRQNNSETLFQTKNFYFCMTNTLREPRIWTPNFNRRTRVLKSVTAAQERLDMRSGCHAVKILPVGVRGTKNIWCLSSLITPNNQPLMAAVRTKHVTMVFRIELPLPFTNVLPKTICISSV